MRGLSLQVLGISTVAVMLVAGHGIGPARAEAQAAFPLVQQLRAGGYVLLMRHAHAPSARPTKEIAETDNLSLERQLDKQGKDSAQAMGEAIRTLHISLTPVLSSPTYRALETVRAAALGHPQTFEQLGDGGQSMMRGAVSGESNWLRNKVAEPPQRGSNTLIVTQMPNIQSVFPQEAADLSDGEALVLHRDGKGSVTLVAKIRIEDWPRLAGQ